MICKEYLSKHIPARIHSFTHLTTLKTRHAQTLVRECFAFSTHPCVSQPRFYESPAGELISAGRCFERRKGGKNLLDSLSGHILCLQLCYFASCVASSYVLTETSKKRERKAKKSIIDLNTCQHEFTLLSILRLKKRGTLRHSSVSASLSQHIRVFSNLVFMSLQMVSS